MYTRITSLESQNTPEQKKKLSDASKRMWNSTGFREKRAASFEKVKDKLAVAHTKWGAGRAEYQRRIKEDSEYRAKYIESVKRGWETRRKNGA